MTRFLAIFLAIAVSATVRADLIMYSGTTTGAPTWNRPTANGTNAPVPPVSGVGTATPYHVQPFYVTENAAFAIQSAGVLPFGWDNYTFLYQGSFDPNSPFSGVVVGNDDNPVVGLSGFMQNLAAGTQYFLVTTGFDNNSSGIFTNTIVGGSQGPGVIVLGTLAIPEPSSLVLFSAIAVGTLGLFRTRKKS